MKPFIFLYFTMISLDACFSASLIKSNDDDELVSSIFALVKKIGIQIPVLLNMSENQKSSVCEDVIGSTWLINLSAGNSNRRKISHGPVAVQTVILDAANELSVPEVMMECSSSITLKGRLHSVKVFVSSTFQRRAFYVGVEDNPVSNEINVFAYMNLTPTYVPFKTRELEEYYVSLRIPVEKLRKNWPHVVESIEKQDPFSSLSATDEAALCASIFEIDYYKKKSIKYTGCVQRPDGKYVVEPLAFETVVYAESLKTENIVCEGAKDGEKYLIFLTRSYNADNSLFVQRKQDGRLFLEAYVKDIPTLINSPDKKFESTRQLDFENYIENFGFYEEEFYNKIYRQKNLY